MLNRANTLLGAASYLWFVAFTSKSEYSAGNDVTVRVIAFQLQVGKAVQFPLTGVVNIVS